MATQEHLRRMPFYWDDEVLGVKPEEGALGSLNGRDTVLKLGMNNKLVVLYTDNDEVCHLQTAAFLALEAGYMNIADYLLDNLEKLTVKVLLQKKEAKEILKAEFYFLTVSLKQLFASSEERDQENFLSYLEAEGNKLALAEAILDLEWLQYELDSYKGVYEDFLSEIGYGAFYLNKISHYDKNDIKRLNKKGEPDEFGGWMYINSPSNGGAIH